MEEFNAIVLKADILVRGDSSEPGDRVLATLEELEGLECCDVLIRETFYNASPEIKAAYDVFIDDQRKRAGLPIMSEKGKGKSKNGK